MGPDEVLFREGDRLAELNILLTGFVAETHGKNGENALTDVIGPVAPIGFASAMLGAASPTGARTVKARQAQRLLVP
jgi:CRP-like cAMP-binding protein